jgi:hypothetical protein
MQLHQPRQTGSAEWSRQLLPLTDSLLNTNIGCSLATIGTKVVELMSLLQEKRYSLY